MNDNLYEVAHIFKGGACGNTRAIKKCATHRATH